MRSDVRSETSAATDRSSLSSATSRSARGLGRRTGIERETSGSAALETGSSRRHSAGSELMAVPEEPTPPRAVPTAAMFHAQPSLPQGPFTFGAEQPVAAAPAPLQRYSSLPSPEQRKAPVQRQADAGQGGASGGKDSDGSDWEDAGRWLEPAAPGAAAALRSALAALAAGTPPSNNQRRRHNSAPGSPRGTPRRGSSSQRPSFTQPAAWTPAGLLQYGATPAQNAQAPIWCMLVGRVRDLADIISCDCTQVPLGVRRSGGLESSPMWAPARHLLPVRRRSLAGLVPSCVPEAKPQHQCRHNANYAQSLFSAFHCAATMRRLPAVDPGTRSEAAADIIATNIAGDAAADHL